MYGDHNKIMLRFGKYRRHIGLNTSLPVTWFKQTSCDVKSAKRLAK